jgi:hypothetical protein
MHQDFGSCLTYRARPGPLLSRMVDCSLMGASKQPGETGPRDVDISLIEEMLRLSPAERLRQNDRAAALATSLREAFAKRTVPWPMRES